MGQQQTWGLSASMAVGARGGISAGHWDRKGSLKADSWPPGGLGSSASPELGVGGRVSGHSICAAQATGQELPSGGTERPREHSRYRNLEPHKGAGLTLCCHCLYPWVCCVRNSLTRILTSLDLRTTCHLLWVKPMSMCPPAHTVGHCPRQPPACCHQMPPSPCLLGSQPPAL